MVWYEAEDIGFI